MKKSLITILLLILAPFYASAAEIVGTYSGTGTYSVSVQALFGAMQTDDCTTTVDIDITLYSDESVVMKVSFEHNIGFAFSSDGYTDCDEEYGTTEREASGNHKDSEFSAEGFFWTNMLIEGAYDDDSIAGYGDGEDIYTTVSFGQYKLTENLSFDIPGSWVGVPLKKYPVINLKLTYPDGTLVEIPTGETEFIAYEKGMIMEPLDPDAALKLGLPDNSILIGAEAVYIEEITEFTTEFFIPRNKTDKPYYTVLPWLYDKNVASRMFDAPIKYIWDHPAKTTKIVFHEAAEEGAIRILTWLGIPGLREADLIKDTSKLMSWSLEEAVKAKKEDEGYQESVIQKSTIVWWWSEGVINLENDKTTVYNQEGTFKLSGADPEKAVTIQSGYTSSCCEQDGAPSEPVPFDPDSIDKGPETGSRFDVTFVDFDDGQVLDWTDDGSGRWSASEDVYVMNGDKGNLIRDSHYNQESCDVSAQVDVQKTAGDGSGYLYGYGLYIRSDGTWRNNYEFNIIRDGRYMIGKSVDGSFTKLVDWTASAAVKAGYDEWNTLKVIAEGSTLEFYANDTLLSTLEDTSLQCGQVGLFAVDAANSAAPDTVEFDNVIMTSATPPPGPAPSTSLHRCLFQVGVFPSAVRQSRCIRN